MQTILDIIQDYHQTILTANNETVRIRLFQSLLEKLYAKDSNALKIITEMNLGSEKKIFNIPLPNRIKRGSADVQYNQIIIEFEKDLTKTGEHAKEQLIEYLAGNWNSGKQQHFTMIATDGVLWKIYVANYDNFTKNIQLKDIELRQINDFKLQATNYQNFYLFIDRYLFRTEKQQPTLENIQRDFGEVSAIFYHSQNTLKAYFEELGNDSELETAYLEWNRFLSIAYSSFDNSQAVFLIHTYLSVFSKILAYMVITKTDYTDDNTLKEILKGSIFEKLNVKNFIETDFYYWIAEDKHFAILKPIFRNMANELADYDFSFVRADILKGVYQELIDRETRHSLGEYYTPDWLCEKIAKHLALPETAKILDPSCGSGSFLIAALTYLKETYPHLTAEKLVSQVVGIDIHPLSVQIAKTTILLGLSDKIQTNPKPLHLQVYLANTILSPDKLVNLFGNEFKLTIDKKTYIVTNEIFNDNTLFDKAVTHCEQLAENTKNKPITAFVTFYKILQNIDKNVSENIAKSFYAIYEGIKIAKENNRDGIWKFILQNSYKPIFLKEKFDFILGNPPWFVFNSIKNIDYQEELLELINRYQLTADTKTIPQVEIAAIFMAHASSYFLNKNGKIAFVLPRSFFTADQHDNIRSGKAKGFTLTEVWDLQEVQPLFNIPACVLFADKNTNGTKLTQQLKGLNVSGKLKYHNATLEEVQNLIKTYIKTFYYSRLDEYSAFTNFEIKQNKEKPYYKDLFKNGATLFPRCFYFVDIISQFKGHHFSERETVLIKTDSNFDEAKMPWKELVLEAEINTKQLFRTALAKNIAPFALINPPLVALPISIHSEKDEENQKITKTMTLENAETLLEKGFMASSFYFEKVEKLWQKHRTERNEKMTSMSYLNWQGKLTAQNLNLRYLVLYNAHGKNANAVVLDRQSLDIDFFSENSSFAFYTNNFSEAHYLAGFLNSKLPNEMIKPFQVTGLFGARSMHKKILSFQLPKFDADNKNHVYLSEIAQNCSKIIQLNFGKTTLIDLTDYNIGTLRNEIKQLIISELEEIDVIVGKLIL